MVRPLKLDRRTILKSAGAAALSPLLPGCGSAGDPMAAVPLGERIDTVVILMQENRSFNHYFGARSLAEGRSEVDGLVAGMSNTNTAGEVVEVHPADASCIVDPPHGWRKSRIQFGEGKNDGFVKAHEEDAGPEEGHRVMGYFDRSTLVASYALADAYTLCQRWFAAIMAPTWPNRFYLLAGQSGGNRSNEWGADYSFLNIFDRLSDAGVRWAVYYGNISFGLLFPRQYPEDSFRPLERFMEDAAAGTLPQVCFVEPIYGRNDDHPPAHPKAGQILIASLYQALATSPQWPRSQMIITYDEHGGFYDHVPPPKVADERSADGFDQLGFRVPALLVGPYVAEGHVSSTVYHHCSVLAFIERLFDIPPLTERDRLANDLTDVLDARRISEGRPRSPVTLPIIEADEAEIYAAACSGNWLNLSTTHSPFGQPELERFFSERFTGHPLDRRDRTDAIHEEMLRYAEKNGILRRV